MILFPAGSIMHRQQLQETLPRLDGVEVFMCLESQRQSVGRKDRAFHPLGKKSVGVKN